MGARQGPGKIQCDALMALRGRDSPFLKLPTIQTKRSKGGRTSDRTKLFNYLLYPGQRQSIKSGSQSPA